MSLTVIELSSALAQAAKEPGLAMQLDRLSGTLEWRDSQGHVLWRQPQDGPDTLLITASDNTWLECFSARPKPGYQSIGALYRLSADFEIQADTRAFMQALPVLELLVEQARNLLHPAVSEPIADDLSLLRGGYTKTSHGWLFTEEAGNPDGPVLCMLHTAGADSRQWHGLMTHPDLQTWRLLAFDMPNHGRSPVMHHAQQWQWHLQESLYIDVVRAFLQAVTNKPVVLMGCSMGAAIGIPLLAKHPALFRAGVLLETPYHSPGRRTPYLDHPQVHGGRLSATWVASLLSPHSPIERRHLARWIYSQSAPGVYDGDLRFYSDEFRANAHTRQVDTSRTPLWLLTGDYDYSASPAETRKVAAEIPGAHFIEMSGFGHFPMTEDPHRLYEMYIKQILQSLGDQAS